MDRRPIVMLIVDARKATVGCLIRWVQNAGTNNDEILINMLHLDGSATGQKLSSRSSQPASKGTGEKTATHSNS
ncbi:hypothetical protein LINPERPRIM_LOCUS34221, partial [Linum perenne]